MRRANWKSRAAYDHVRYSLHDYNRLGEIWNGLHPEDGKPLVVVDGPPEGVPYPDLPAEPQLAAPYGDPEMFADIAKKMFGSNSL